MKFVLQQIAGLILLAGLAFLMFTSITGTSAERLSLVKLEAESLDGKEAIFRNRERDHANPAALDAEFPKDLVWVASSDSAAELMMQKSVLDAAAAAGLQLSSFGASDGPSSTRRPTLGFEIEGTGGHSQLIKFLAEIEKATPRLAVSSLWIRQVAPSHGQLISPVDLRMTVWAYREQSK